MSCDLTCHAEFTYIQQVSRELLLFKMAAPIDVWLEQRPVTELLVLETFISASSRRRMDMMRSQRNGTMRVLVCGEGRLCFVAWEICSSVTSCQKEPLTKLRSRLRRVRENKRCFSSSMTTPGYT